MGVKLTVGDFIRRADTLYAITKLYRQNDSITPVHSIELEEGMVTGNRIQAKDINGDEVKLQGLLRSGTPDDFLENIDLSNTINIFVSKDATDLVYDGDLVTVKIGGCARIVEYAKGLTMFKDKEKILAILTQNKRKTTYTFQWKSNKHDPLRRRLGN